MEEELEKLRSRAEDLRASPLLPPLTLREENHNEIRNEAPSSIADDGDRGGEGGTMESNADGSEPVMEDKKVVTATMIARKRRKKALCFRRKGCKS